MENTKELEAIEKVAGGRNDIYMQILEALLGSGKNLNERWQTPDALVKRIMQESKKTRAEVKTALGLDDELCNQSPEIGESSTENVNTLQIELENLIKAKNIKLPGYHRNATDFRKNLIKQNPIFVERPVDEKIHTLKKIKEWFLHPEQIEGVNFGEELFNTQPWQRTKKYYNGALYDHPFYSGMILQNREQVIMNLIEKITKRKYIFGDNIPELAFLPLVLDMTAGGLTSKGERYHDWEFYLRVSNSVVLLITNTGGMLIRNSDSFYPVRSFS